MVRAYKVAAAGLLLGLLLGALGWWLLRPKPPVLLIRNVSVIDATGAPEQHGITVMIRGERIESLGPSAGIQAPSGAQVVDGSGKFLIPGLWDMHVHLTAAGEPAGSRDILIPLLLVNGITGVRDMGAHFEQIQKRREEMRRGELLGPRIFTAGPYVDGPEPSFQPAMVVTDAASAREAVRKLVGQGVDFIKVQTRVPREAYLALAAEAKRLKIPFAGHVPDAVEAWEAAHAGQASIEHLTQVLFGCKRRDAYIPWSAEQWKQENPEPGVDAEGRPRTWIGDWIAAYDNTEAEKLFTRMRNNRTWHTPTLVLLRNRAFLGAEGTLPAPDQLRFIPAALQEIWKQGALAWHEGLSYEETNAGIRLFQRQQQLVGDMLRAGLAFLAGTDTPAPYLFPGFSLHQELELLVQSGLSEMDALQAATRNAAGFLGVLDSYGTIEKGKIADLLLLEANPLQNIRNTGEITAVILGGRYLDRSALDRLLAGAEQAEKK